MEKIDGEKTALKKSQTKRAKGPGIRKDGADCPMAPLFLADEGGGISGRDSGQQSSIPPFSLLSRHLTWVGGVLGASAGLGMVIHAIKSYPIHTGGLPYIFWPHLLPIVFQFSLGGALLFTLLGFGGELSVQAGFFSQRKPAISMDLPSHR